VTATEVAPVVAAATANAPAPAAPTPAPAGNESAKAPPAAEAAKGESASPLLAAAKVAAEADYSAIKAGEHIRPSTLKAFVAGLGEHKIDAKTGQALLDKVQSAVKAEQDAQIKGWVEELGKDADFGPDKLPATLKSIAAAMKLAPDGVGEKLQKLGLDSIPVIAQWALRVGRVLEERTATDTTAIGNSNGEMTETERWRANNPNTIAGLKSIGVTVN
jgi:hypothetical protein